MSVRTDRSLHAYLSGRSARI